jgi:cytidylate kinase
MEKQLIIAVSREYGSGGRQIAKALAERFGIGYYDRNMLDEIANEKEANANRLKKFDEVPKRSFLYRTVRGVSNSPEEIIANIQFEYLCKKAESGESFVVVGRCAEEVLAKYPGLVRLFVLADAECKVKRISESRKMGEDEARGAMYRHDKKRKAYHNYYCTNKWGDSRGYDLTVNSSRLGVEKTVDFLEHYIRMRIEK